MILIRWLILNFPYLRIGLLITYLTTLLGAPWIPYHFFDFISWVAQGFLQGIFASFLSASFILLLSIPFFPHFLKQLKQKNIDLASIEYKFVSKINKFHFLLSVIIITGSFYFLSDLKKPEIQLVFFLTLFQYFLYIYYTKSTILNLNFYRHVESGIILLVSLPLVAMIFTIANLQNENWNPFESNGRNLILLSTVVLLMSYQWYLDQKLIKIHLSVKE